MMHMFLNILVGVVLLAVLGVLAAGMIGFARNGDPRRSNKLMQWRVMLQGAALILIVLLMSLLRG
jgi:ABC-type Na+ efflux pump permease subunit